MLEFRTNWTVDYRKQSGFFYRNALRRRTELRAACTKASRKNAKGEKALHETTSEFAERVAQGVRDGLRHAAWVR